MGYTESLMGWSLKEVTHAKAQRRKGGSNSLCPLNVLCVFFAPLRLCVRTLLLTLLITMPCASQPRAPMRTADVLKVANVSDAQISPNGQWVVYSVSSVEGFRFGVASRNMLTGQ